MRKVTIDFTKEPVEVSDRILGKQGEHNATELIIIPPTEMTENEEIVNYSVAFQTGAYRKFYSEVIEKSETISVFLERTVTQVSCLAIQLEAYDGKENLLIKSERIDNLILEPSVVGDEQKTQIISGVIEQISANTSFRNKFSEDENGGLLYDGKSIKRPYETIECETVIFAMQIENKWVIGVYSELPVKGVEIKTVRIRTADYGDVDLRFMGNVPGQSSYPSYALNFCTLNSDDSTGFSSTIAIIEFTYGANDIIQAISNYDVSYFEIDYYTD